VLNAMNSVLDRGAIDVFLGGEEESQIKCEEVEGSEWSEPEKNPFRKLAVNITKKSKELLDIRNLLYGLQQQYGPSSGMEIIKRNETLGRDAIHVRRAFLSRLPEYLVIQLVRFEWKVKENVRAKVLKSVEFPFTLDMSSCCSEHLKKEMEPYRKYLNDLRDGERELKRRRTLGEDINASDLPTPAKPDGLDAPGNHTGYFELCGVVSHQGRTADGGHYVAWIKWKGEQWLLFDDDRVREVTEQNIRELYGGADNHIAYILLYRSRRSDGTVVGP